MDVDDPGLPFRIPDSFKSRGLYGAFELREDVAVPTLFQSLDFAPVLKPLSIPERLEDIFAFNDPFRKASPPESYVDSEILTEGEEEEDLELNEVQLWAQAGKEITIAPHVYSWEGFLNASEGTSVNAYLSEAPQRVFDTVIEGGYRVQSSLFTNCVRELGLGLESVLFKFDGKPGKALRIEGITAEVATDYAHYFRDCGSTIRALRTFTSVSLKKETRPGLVGFALLVRDTVESLHTQIYTDSRDSRSLLQLEDAFEAPYQLLSTLEHIRKIAQGAANDLRLMNALYEYAQISEQQNLASRSLILDALVVVSGPWLRALEVWIGAKPTDFGLSKELRTFVEEKDEGTIFVPQEMPVFLPAEDAEKAFQTGIALQMLRAFDPNGPLLEIRGSGPGLEWKFGWESARSVTDYVTNYRREVSKPIGTNNSCEAPQAVRESSVYGCTAEQIEAAFAQEFDMMTALPVIQSASPMNDIYSSGTDLFQLPLALIPRLSFSPLLAAQSALINTALVRLSFQKYNLIFNLETLKSVFLFASPTFSSLLSSALFTSSHGLTLEKRESWPPASSELQLALSDVLATTAPSLPGGLSFSIREMPEEELDQCLDARSIAALDFLRIKYTPFGPLEAIITEKALERYDRMYRLLLRVRRIDAAVIACWRNSKRGQTGERFIQTAMHFLGCLKTYISTIAIDSSFTALQRYLSLMNHSLQDDEYVADVTINDIREQHEKALEVITEACFLKKRQTQYMNLITKILSKILAFALGDGGDLVALNNDVGTLVKSCGNAGIIQGVLADLLNFNGAYGVA